MIRIVSGFGAYKNGKRRKTYSREDGPFELPGDLERKWVEAGIAEYVRPDEPDEAHVNEPEEPDEISEDKTEDTYSDDVENYAGSPDYGEWAFSELKEECIARGIDMPSRPTKEKLAKLLFDDDATVPSFDDETV